MSTDVLAAVARRTGMRLLAADLGPEVPDYDEAPSVDEVPGPELTPDPAIDQAPERQVHFTTEEDVKRMQFEDSQKEAAEKARKNDALDTKQILMSTVLHHLKQHKLKADYPDDAQNSVLVVGTLAQTLMAMASLGWTHGEEEEVSGGLYCSGTAITLEGPQALRLIQTSINKVTIWPAQDPSTIPQESPKSETAEDRAANYPREDLESQPTDQRTD